MMMAMNHAGMAAGEAAAGDPAAHARVRDLLLPVLVLIAGAAISVGSFLVIQDNVDTEAKLRFERQASDAQHVIEARINAYFEVLHGLAALFAKPGLSRAEFHRYVTALELPRRYPGFAALNFAESFPHAARADFEARVRRDTSLDPKGYPGFAIKPAGVRPEYLVISYLSPMDDSNVAFGLDLRANWSDPSQRARQREDDVLRPAPHPLENDKSASLPMRLPVYRFDDPLEKAAQRRTNYIGSVGAGFRARELMRGALEESTLRFMRVKFYDGGPVQTYVPGSSVIDERRLLFNSDDIPQPREAERWKEESLVRVMLPMEIGERIWEVQFAAPRDAFIKGIDRTMPALALGVGLLVSAFLFAILHSLAASRARAEQMAIDLRFVATHDALTGLANRAWFHDQLKHALARAARYRRGVALLFIDLDRFKIVNDTLGHGAGDRMLHECARRLKKCLRESDTVGRLGGDEFVVMMEDYSAVRDIVTVAQKILAHFAVPVLLESREFTPSASIGISIYPDDGMNVEALLKNADIAMYRAKDRGRNNHQFYSVQNNRQQAEAAAGILERRTV